VPERGRRHARPPSRQPRTRARTRRAAGVQGLPSSALVAGRSGARRTLRRPDRGCPDVPDACAPSLAPEPSAAATAYGDFGRFRCGSSWRRTQPTKERRRPHDVPIVAELLHGCPRSTWLSCMKWRRVFVRIETEMKQGRRTISSPRDPRRGQALSLDADPRYHAHRPGRPTRWIAGTCSDNALTEIARQTLQTADELDCDWNAESPHPAPVSCRVLHDRTNGFYPPGRIVVVHWNPPRDSYMRAKRARFITNRRPGRSPTELRTTVYQADSLNRFTQRLLAGTSGHGEGWARTRNA